MKKTVFLRGSNWILTHFGIIDHQRADSILYRSQMTNKEWLALKSALSYHKNHFDLRYGKQAKAIVKLGENIFTV